jgi:hypothetical protein
MMAPRAAPSGLSRLQQQASAEDLFDRLAIEPPGAKHRAVDRAVPDEREARR